MFFIDFLYIFHFVQIECSAILVPHYSTLLPVIFDRFFIIVDAVSYTHLDVYKRQVEFCPQGGSFFTQGVVVRERCDSGIAFFAVQSAATDQLIHKSSSYRNYFFLTARQ